MSAGKENKGFQFGNHTDVGKVRQANEDYLGYFETQNGYLFVVCDGMGGHVGGATAAQLAVESIRTFFEHGRYDHLPEALRQAILYANQQIIAYAAQNTHLRGMGTTCVVVIVREGVVYYAHAGDSRIYLQSGQRLTRLTKDHSVVQQMVDSGMISEEEAENHPRKNEITQALGTMPKLDVAVCDRPLYPADNDTLLLCTDGLNGMISDKNIEQVLNEKVSLQHKALRLVELANEAGGYDNITVQLIQFISAVTSTASIADTMAATKNKKNTTKTNVSNAAKNQKIDPALIILCLLIGFVAILFFMGRDQLSDDTISTSELKLEQAAATSDEESAESTKSDATAEVPAAEKKTVTNPPVTPKKAEPAKPAAVKNTTAATPEKAASGTSGETFITHTVRSGETFSAVARRYNVTNQTLQSWNPSIKDTDIKADATQLRVKVKATHTVGAGDVLDVLSKKYGVSKELIMAANGKTADRASRGEKLVIPFAEKK
jgi:serine/threonine protein phosphatase PrpC